MKDRNETCPEQPKWIGWMNMARQIDENELNIVLRNND